MLITIHLQLLQYHRGRAPSAEVWVIGMVVISHTPALGYIEIVPRRDDATLPMINIHIIYFDG